MSRIAAAWSGLSAGAQRAIIGGAVGVLGLSVAGFAVLGGGGDEAEAPKAKATTTTTAAPTTTTTEPPATGPVAPLTGMRVAEEDALLLLRPPLAMKVDNLDVPGETAVPQAGLLQADVVFEEIVEGDITRLVPVFHSRQPGRVGPIRSARTTDVGLLPQLGRPLLGWSGGNEGVTAAVRSSPAIVDVGWDRAVGSYARDPSRRAPHNLYAQADELWALAPEGAGPPPPLFQYRAEGEANPPTAQPSQGVDIRWGGGSASSPVSWRWDAKNKVYVRAQNSRVHTDEGGDPITAANVVVLVTDYGSSAADTRSPEAITTGSGELFAFTNGGVVHGRWDRPDPAKPATLVDDAGQPVKLTPGQTWIELPRAGNTTAVAG